MNLGHGIHPNIPVDHVRAFVDTVKSYSFKMLAKNQSPKESFARYVRTLQDEICHALEALDGEAVFVEDQWDRDGGGGGWTRIMDGGRLFEKAGVNVSAVHGTTPEVIKNQVPESAAEFYATGISLVIHPINPMIPTVHANFRFFQLMDTEGNIVDGWFGGGADLTPYYLFEEDAVHFHQTLKMPAIVIIHPITQSSRIGVIAIFATIIEKNSGE